MAVNWKTQKAYRGINQIMLDGGEYATFKQITEAGGSVKKGAKSEFIVFWKWLENENDKGEKESVPLLRYYRVFNVLTQAEGLESKRQPKPEFEHDKIEQCENVIAGYMDKPDFTYVPNVGAWYKPFHDVINIPPLKDFKQVEEYYTTTFHEMIHSTGHQRRLNRDGITATASFGSETYSKEELVAEIGASMLASVAGIDNSTIDNAVAYIQSWLRALKDDRTLLVKAGGQAQKAVDLILGTSFAEGE